MSPFLSTLLVISSTGKPEWPMDKFQYFNGIKKTIVGCKGKTLIFPTFSYMFPISFLHFPYFSHIFPTCSIYIYIYIIYIYYIYIIYIYYIYILYIYIFSQPFPDIFPTFSTYLSPYFPSLSRRKVFHAWQQCAAERRQNFGHVRRRRSHRKMVLQCHVLFFFRYYWCIVKSSDMGRNQADNLRESPRNGRVEIGPGLLSRLGSAPSAPRWRGRICCAWDGEPWEPGVRLRSRGDQPPRKTRSQWVT